MLLFSFEVCVVLLFLCAALGRKCFLGFRDIEHRLIDVWMMSRSLEGTTSEDDGPRVVRILQLHELMKERGGD